MNRIEFMEQLEQLLADIPVEEKEDALAFYTNYFEDAGEENEEKIIRELKSPERVALIIKSDLSANGEYSRDGEYTERGYKDATDSKESIIKVSPSASADQPTEGENQSSNENQSNMQGQYQNTNQNNNQGMYQNTNQYQRQGQYQNTNQNQNQSQYQNMNQYNNQGQNQNTNQYQNHGNYNNQQQQYGYQAPAKTNIALLILLCIFTLPVILPITITIFSVVFGLTVGFGAAGFACTVSGFVVVFAGIAKAVSIPALGALAIGSGMVCFGVGLLFFMLSSLFARIFPVLCKVVGAIFRAPFGGRRVTA